MPAKSLLSALFAPLLLGGCAIAGAAADVVTLPVKAVGAGVDMATTSQEEADRNRGRAIRQREQAIGELAEERDDAARDCLDRGRVDACDEMRAIDGEIERMRSAPAY